MLSPASDTIDPALGRTGWSGSAPEALSRLYRGKTRTAVGPASILAWYGRLYGVVPVSWVPARATVAEAVRVRVHCAEPRVTERSVTSCTTWPARGGGPSGVSTAQFQLAEVVSQLHSSAFQSHVPGEYRVYTLISGWKFGNFLQSHDRRCDMRVGKGIWNAPTRIRCTRPYAEFWRTRHTGSRLQPRACCTRGPAYSTGS